MRTITTLALMLLSTFAYSQKTTDVTYGNAKTNTNLVDLKKTYDLDTKIPKTREQQIGKATLTNSVAIYKTVEYPVYLSVKNKAFIVYPNKDNTGYNKKYIVTN